MIKNYFLYHYTSSFYGFLSEGELDKGLGREMFFSIEIPLVFLCRRSEVTSEPYRVKNGANPTKRPAHFPRYMPKARSYSRRNAKSAQKYSPQITTNFDAY